MILDRAHGRLSLARTYGGCIRVNGQNNTIRSTNARSVNQGTINAGGAFDLQDTQPACDNNVWQSNVFITRSQPCIN